MIAFYPIKSARWTDFFDFSRSITLTPKEKPDHKIFRSRQELIEFLKSFGIVLSRPMRITSVAEDKQIGLAHQGSLSMIQLDDGEILGWIRDDFR